MKGKYLLLGTNLGDRFANLEQARELIIREVGEIINVSSVYETAPWGIKDQPFFLNQVIKIKTNLPAGDLLDVLLSIERKLGRERSRKWDSRLIDIDILFYDDSVIESDLLILPHPEIQNRRFTLVPLNEIAGNEIHPILNKTIGNLLEETPDLLETKKIPDTNGIEMDPGS
ncbi:2-amino-4-hydroxy-6-hydroxymethyldihydropteridine diphosphokinase [Bacteroidota bacterium]